MACHRVNFTFTWFSVTSHCFKPPHHLSKTFWLPSMHVWENSFHRTALGGGIFKVNHEKNHTHFLLIAQEVVQNFLGNPHMQETCTRQVTEIAKVKVVGHGWINTILQGLQECVVILGRWPTPQTYLKYRGADKSLARPGRKQVQKHVKTRAISTTSRHELSPSFLFPARQVAEGNSCHSDRKHKLVSFLDGIRTYQHPCRNATNLNKENKTKPQDIQNSTFFFSA